MTAVETALGDELGRNGITVGTFICVHRADLPWRSPVVEGFRIVSGRGLVRRLREAPPVLAPADVARLIVLVAGRLAPVVREARLALEERG